MSFRRSNTSERNIFITSFNQIACGCSCLFYFNPPVFVGKRFQVSIHPKTSSNAIKLQSSVNQSQSQSYANHKHSCHSVPDIEYFHFPTISC